MTAQIYACYFGAGAADQWPRMARVLAHTASAHCPAWRVTVEALGPAPPAGRRRESFVDNTHKLEAWQRVVDEAPDGSGVLLLDVDTFITRPLDTIWDLPFDLAYTVRPPGVTIPFNAGVVFLRASDRTRAFMASWVAENRRLLEHDDASPGWRRRFAGVNQGALGLLLERRLDLEVRELPCLEWNCEDASWEHFDPSVTRIVHVKSHLRNCLFNGGIPIPRVEKLMRLWRRLEQQAQVAAAQVV